ncbi:MAG: glycosyltransferase [Ignavibacteriae bacterium]|nr:glycosyltransferase [Ignavibacteriota bacterium]
MNQNPKISIITVCKNSESTILKCIESVLNQSYNNLEYIIVDGVSSDKTISIITGFRDKISKIISEPDSGIYDAMNKGVQASSGDYILFLNADDFLISENTIDNFAEYLSSEKINKADIYFGKVLIFNNENGIGNLWKAAKVSKYSLFRGSIPHPATFFKSESFKKCGLFDITYKISADYEWFVRALIKYHLTFVRNEIIVSVFNKGGVSTKNSDEIIKNEKKKIHKTYYSFWERMYYNFRWFIKKI